MIQRLRRLSASIREDIDVVVDRDPAVTTRCEALFAPHLPALWLHRVAHRCYRGDYRVLARILSLLGRLLSGGVEIHPGARIGRRLFIDHASAVVIGETAIVGTDVTLYHQVTLGAVGWWRDRLRDSGARRHPQVGDRVVIGTNATILGPVTIGPNARIGANALVTSDVPAGATVLAPLGQICQPTITHPRLARSTRQVIPMPAQDRR
jgi:serine O-acetyltransferase